MSSSTASPCTIETTWSPKSTPRSTKSSGSGARWQATTTASRPLRLRLISYPLTARATTGAVPHPPTRRHVRRSGCCKRAQFLLGPARRWRRVLAWPLPPLWGWERHLSLSPRPDAGLGPARTVVGVAVGVAVEVMPPLMRVAGAGTPGLHLGEKLCVHSPSRNKSLGSNGLENYPTGFTGCGWGRLVTCSTTAQGATPQKETHNDQLPGSPPKRHC